MADTEYARFETMTNVELRAELKRRGCSTSGNKKDLLTKLRAALEREYAQNQTIVQHPSVYNLPVEQETYPVIPISRQLPVSITEFLSANFPEVKDVSFPTKTNPPIDENANTTSITNEQIVLDYSNNVEVNSFVSTSKEDEEKTSEKLGNELYLSSVGNSSSATLESIIKEIPLSDEQQRLNQSETKNEIPNSTVETTNSTDTIDQSSTIQKQEIATEEQSSSTNKESDKSQMKSSSRSQNTVFIKSFNRSTTNKINLSSEFLQTLIPDLSLLSESIVNAELDDSDQNNESIVETEMNNDFLPSDSLTIGELADQKVQSNRTVAIDDLSARKKSNVTPVRLASFEGKTTNIVTDEPVRIKDPTITHEPPSEILYIRGLTRPFSLLQLKELLSRYGTLVDREFWLDKIKSQCFVTYSTLEEGQNAREALDGCRWPSTNPKTLSVRFGRQEELEFSKIHDLPPEHMSMEKNFEDRIVREEPMSPVEEMEPKKRSDASKLQKDKTSGFLIIEEEELPSPVKNHEQPSKGLDEYFRKTKAKPSIYWLPLTDEQIIERDHRQEQRKAERDEEQRQRDQENNLRKVDKRQRSSSPPRRDSKRH